MAQLIRKEDALEYHEKGRPGKIEVIPTKETKTQRDLARAELKRYEELRKQNFVSQAVLDARKSAFSSAP